MILWRLPTSSISRVLKMYKRLNKISQFLLSFLHIHVSHQRSKTSFHISITGISPNLNLAAANGTSLTWSTVPFSTHATGLWGGDAAVFLFNSHSTSHTLAVIVIGWLSVSQTWNGNLPSFSVRKASVESWTMRVDGSIASCQVSVGRRVLSWVWLSVCRIYVRSSKYWYMYGCQVLCRSIRENLLYVSKSLGTPE